MHSFGERLRCEREARNRTIEDIAAATGIQLGYLEALEKNEFHALPGRAFGKLYTRAYAEILGFDPQPLIDHYDREQRQQGSGAATRPLPAENVRGAPSQGREGVRPVEASIADWRQAMRARRNKPERSGGLQAIPADEIADSMEEEPIDGLAAREPEKLPEEEPGERIDSVDAREPEELLEEDPGERIGTLAAREPEELLEEDPGERIGALDAREPEDDRVERIGAFDRVEAAPVQPDRESRETESTAGTPAAGEAPSETDVIGADVPTAPSNELGNATHEMSFASRSSGKEASRSRRPVPTALLICATIVIAASAYLALFGTGSRLDIPSRPAPSAQNPPGRDRASAETRGRPSAEKARAPRPTGPAAMSSAEFSPAPRQEEPAAVAPKPAGRLEVPEFALGRRIVNHRLLGQEERFTVGEVALFSTRVLGGKPGESIRHVWLREGRVVQSIVLELRRPDWRTYSRKTIGNPGLWTVEARDEQGRVLARATLTSVSP